MNRFKRELHGFVFAIGVLTVCYWIAYAAQSILL